jgi:hypothetical protein
MFKVNQIAHLETQTPASLALEIRFTSLDPHGSFAAATDILSIEATSRVKEKSTRFLPERALVAYAPMLCVQANYDEALESFGRHKNDSRSMLRDAAKAQLRAGLEMSFLEAMRHRLAQLLSRLAHFSDTFSTSAGYISEAGLRYAADFPLPWWQPVYQEIFQVIGDKRLALGIYAREAFTGFLRNLESAQTRGISRRSESSASGTVGAPSYLVARIDEINLIETTQALRAAFDQHLTSMSQKHQPASSLDSEITAILLSYHVMHRAMQLLMAELYFVFSETTQEAEGQSRQPIPPNASRLMNLLESMYGRFSGALRQSDAIQSRCLSDRGQHNALLSQRFRAWLTYEKGSQLYLQVFEKFLNLRLDTGKLRGGNWLRERPGLGQAAYVVWAVSMQEGPT